MMRPVFRTRQFTVFVDHFKISTAVVSRKFEKAIVDRKPNNAIERYGVASQETVSRFKKLSQCHPHVDLKNDQNTMECGTVEQSTVTAGPPGLLRSEPSGEP